MKTLNQISEDWFRLFQWNMRAENFINCQKCLKKGICEDDCSSPLKTRKWRRRYRIWNAIVRVEFT